jgi:hypothetical protein
MAVPIQPTPTLWGDESTTWWEQVEKEQSKKVPLVPTPKLEELRQEILASATKRKK